MRLSLTDPATAAAVVEHLRAAGHTATTEQTSPSLFSRLLGGKAVTHVDFPDDAAAKLLAIADDVGITPEQLCGAGARARFEEALEKEGKRIYERRGGYLDLRGKDDASHLVDEERAWVALIGTPAEKQVAWWREVVSGRRSFDAPPPSTALGDLVAISDGELGVGSLALENLRREHPDASPEELDAVTKAYVERAAKAFREGRLAEEGLVPTAEAFADPTKLRAGFITQERIDATVARLPDDARPLARFVLQPTAVPDLFVMPVIDGGRSLHPVLETHLAGLGLTGAEALRRGLEQLGDDPVPNATMEWITPDVPLVTLAADDGFAAVRVLYRGVHEAVEGALGGPAVYAIPSRDVLLATKANSLTARLALWAQAKGTFESAPWPIRPGLLRIDHDGLRPLTDAELFAKD